jgi:hypothetical protein
LPGAFGQPQARRTRAFFGAAVVSLAVKKLLFLNVRRERPLVSLFGKKSCDINEWLALSETLRARLRADGLY